jgi:hypothetical protein
MPQRATAFEMRLTVEAALAALVAPRVARLRPESMHRVLEARLRPARTDPCSDEQVMHIVDRVLNRVPRSSRNWCLVRGITGYRLLRSNGREVHLVFGARLLDDQLEAHCWLSDGITPIHERAKQGTPFGEMFRITPAGVIIPIAQ